MQPNHISATNALGLAIQYRQHVRANSTPASKARMNALQEVLENNNSSPSGKPAPGGDGVHLDLHLTLPCVAQGYWTLMHVVDT